MKTTAKGIAAAVAAAALIALGATTPALAGAAPMVDASAAAVETRRVATADAIASLVRSRGLSGADVDGASGAYAVTLANAAGVERTAFVDAATDVARAALDIASAAAASGLTWRDVEGVEWRVDGAGDVVVTLLTTRGTECVAVVDAHASTPRAA